MSWKIMNEKEVTENLVSAIMFYGIVKGWDIAQLLEVYDYLGVSRDTVDDILGD